MFQMSKHQITYCKLERTKASSNRIKLMRPIRLIFQRSVLNPLHLVIRDLRAPKSVQLEVSSVFRCTPAKTRWRTGKTIIWLESPLQKLFSIGAEHPQKSWESINHFKILSKFRVALQFPGGHRGQLLRLLRLHPYGCRDTTARCAAPDCRAQS